MRRWFFGLVFLVFPGCAATAPAEAGPKTSGRAPMLVQPVQATARKPAPIATPVATNEPAADPDDDDEEGPDDDEAEAAEAEGSDAEAPVAAPPPPKPPSPLLALSVTQLEARYRSDPASVGPLSLGATNAGALVNGVQMPKSEKWIVQDPSCAWGTQETVDAIARSIEKVAAEHPGAPPLAIGHISSKKGGHLSPHRSHQSGRDVDLGYYHNPPKTTFVRATESNLDLERTFAFVKTIVSESDVELVLIDTAVQRLLVAHALRKGEDEAWLDQVFQVRGKHPRPVVRHARGHGNHLHVRYVSPVAQELGRRAGAFLKREKVAPPHVADAVVMHKARSGDTLQILARRYGTTVEAIQGANGLKTIDIKMGRTYRIPVPKPQAPPKAPPVPKRRVAPPPRAAAGATRGPSAHGR
ncbi:penicillin-insensitive murein endopeptidase [Polyangium fumosum]|uniref:LysM peptidoglycan-binding domain-containing protein n=1 Tax=Polyangium fumosum TaxID=889272 RepID=A0A4U1IUQ1_9BACT|nr:penicillin-insensitive murein endopeptidase [Polyangium fumosum]TKC98097.1 LysM peptidoglycan-binding domain-containing protein [Polyangium fumosum]